MFTKDTQAHHAEIIARVCNRLTPCIGGNDFEAALIHLSQCELVEAGAIFERLSSGGDEEAAVSLLMAAAVRGLQK